MERIVLSDTVIVTESETDAARLTILYPTVDVAVLPAGAKGIRPEYGEQLSSYGRVLLGLDNDESGEAGVAKLTQIIAHAVRFAPPTGHKDWGEYVGDAPPLPEAAAAPAVLVSAGELMDLEMPDVTSWFEGALLPIGGQMVLHGWAKSFKSYLSLDLASALAQGQDWCGFEPIEEPCKVAVVQFEIPAPYYRQRIAAMQATARDRKAFDENFMTWTPLSRPQLRAGIKEQEEFVRRTLVTNHVQVAVFDPVRRLMKAGQSMNDEDSVRAPLQFFESLQNEGITVVFCHHDNKGSAKSGGGDALDMTGSGAWAGDADSILSVALPKGERRENPRRNIHFLLRNAPSPDPRGMQLREDGTIIYSTEPYGPEEDDGEPKI
jgi:hypothetical protein